MPPEKTLGVTFTNRAAEHMRTAVSESCGADAKDCRIEARDLGLPADFVIKRVKAEFGPVTELSLCDNYRASKALLRFTDWRASTITHRSTEVRDAPSLADGMLPEFHHPKTPLLRRIGSPPALRASPAPNTSVGSASSPAPTSARRLSPVLSPS